LPKGNDGLAAAYDQALERIDDQLQGHRDLGNRVLSWVIHACRPLTVEELRYALAMAQHSTVDPGALHDSSNLTAFCAGLVIIGNQDSTVRLVHFTVQSYFEAVRRKRYPDADKLIAETCLKYIDQTLSLYPLSEDEDEELELDFDLEEEISRRMPFFLYSSQEWVYHAYRARDFEHELCDSILRLEDKPIALEVCGLSIWGINMDHYCRGITLLMVAALFGFETTIKKLLERGADVNAETRKHYVLHYAVLGGKPHIVSMLLDNGADVNCQGTKLRTPLHYVLHDERMVRLLLERGADLNMRNQHYKSALHQLLSEWKDRDEWEENWNIKKRPRNAEGEQPLWDIPLDAHYESAMELLLEEWKSKEEVKSIDVEERLWEVSKLMLGDSKADFERLGPSLLQDAKKWGVPERVKDLIRARMSMEH
jgi:Ankyrin repeats (3 copies)